MYFRDYPQSYKFVRERLLYKGEAPVVKFYDMNTGQMVWSVEEPELTGSRILWNGLDMDYNRGVIGTMKFRIFSDKFIFRSRSFEFALNCIYANPIY
jgi:hypothetical protein